MVRNLACIVLVSVLAAIVFSACGGTVNETDVLDAPRFTAELNRTDSIVSAADGLELVPFNSGDGPSFNLVGPDLAGAKAVFGSVNYDPARYHFVGSEQAGGFTEDDRLLLCLDSPGRGVVEVGWVLTRYEDRPGLDGDVELCRLSFAAGPARQISKTIKIGKYNEFEITGEVNDDDQPHLVWREAFGGDGNNDGLISVADITKIGQYYQQQSSASPAAEDADFDANGLVAVTDLAVIGQQWNVDLAGYAIMAGPDAESLTELTRFARVDMFNDPASMIGPLTWTWTGDVLEEDTTYKVQPYDKFGELGLACTNSVTLVAPDPTITIDQIYGINLPAGLQVNGDGDYIILISELSVDDIADNTEDPAVFPEFLQLTATVSSLEEPEIQFDTSERVVWFVENGSGIGYVGNQESVELRDTKGRVTFINRGAVTVTAHVPNHTDRSESVTFLLYSIDSINLAADQTSVAAGAPVQFTATGTFDWDNLINGNEEELDITNWCNWGSLSTPSTATYSIDTYTGILDTTGAAGAQISVSCEFPREENVTIHDNARRASNIVDIDVS